MHNTKLNLFLVFTVVLALGCVGTAKQQAKINAGPKPTKEAAERTARKYVRDKFEGQGMTFDSLQVKGIYTARSMWVQEDMFVIPLEVRQAQESNYFYVLVGRETGKVYPYNTDFRSVFRLTEDKYNTYFDVNWVSMSFQANAPAGSEMKSCTLVRVTGDTPDPNARINNTMNWGFFVWLVEDEDGNHYFLTSNGVVHKIELTPEVVGRIYQPTG